MPWPALRASLDLLIASSQRPVTVEFSGGEPFLEFPLIRRAVRYLARQRVPTEFTVTTNGTDLTEGVAAFLDRHAIGVRLSFHSAPSVCERRDRETFRRLDRLLDSLRKHHRALWRNRLQVGVTIGIDDVSSLAETIEYLVEKDVRQIAMSAAIGQPGWRVERIDEIERQFQRITALAARHYAATGTLPVALYRKDGSGLREEKAGIPWCNGALGHSFSVDPTGHAYGCVMLAGARPVVGDSRVPDDAGVSNARASESSALALGATSPLWAFHLGDVRDRRFAQRLRRYPSTIRSSRMFQRRRTQRSSYGECGRCRFLMDCAICPGASAFATDRSDARRVSDFVCAFTRVSLTHRNRFPSQPSAEERRCGRTRVPTLVRELQEHAASLKP
jgi:sulfatase maturation enzyme AslB (radical SAM superfamily)